MNTTTTVSLFEGAYQFDRFSTEDLVDCLYILSILEKQWLYRKTTETLWAESETNIGIKSRFEFQDHEVFKLF